MRILRLLPAVLIAAALHGPSPARGQCPVPALAAATGSGALPRTAARLKAGGPLRILAIGSSTTAGIGAGGLGYAHRLGALLKARWPRTAVEIAASGVLAETAAGAAARLPAELGAHKPDLVVWQLGTNDATFAVPEAAFRAAMASGLAAIRAAGADALLIDPQFSRWAEGSQASARIAALIAAEARRHGAAVVPRHAAMLRLARADRPAFEALLSWDGLHLSPAGHACMASQVAGAIARGAGRR